MDTLANSEDPDEMSHNAAFHQVLHCLLRQNLHRDRNTIIFRNFNFDPAIYTMDHSDLIVYFFMGNSIGHKRVKR